VTRAGALSCVALLVTASRVAGQPSPAPQPSAASAACQGAVELVRNATAPADRQAAATALVTMNLHPRCFSEILLRGQMQRDAFARLLKAFESSRTDKHAGSMTGIGGSTNLVAKGTTAKVLSFAAEYGALTQTVNKQVVTVQGSLDGVPAALVRQRVLPYCPAGASSPDCLHSGVFETLRRVSYGVSFDTSAGAQQTIGTAAGPPSGTAQPVTFAAEGHSIVAANVRINVLSTRDVSSSAFQAAWLKALKTQSSAQLMSVSAQALLIALDELLQPILGDPAYRAWQQETISRLAGAAADKIDEIWIDRERALAAMIERDHAPLVERAAEFSRALTLYQFEQEDLVRSVADTPVLAVQYDLKRSNDQLATSTVRALFDKGFGTRWSVAANGAVEFYNDDPPASVPGATRVRDAQFGVQVQRDLGTLPLVGAAAISGTYYFQYQNGPSILKVTPGAPVPGITFTPLPSTASLVFADTGHLHIAQVRLVLGAPSSSARFPLGISYSNRTELIDKSVLRAQFGVSYDFDSLFAR
jgi:hypothetical protein